MCNNDRDTIYYQNLAYCRYIHIWYILYIFNIIIYSPLLSLYIISIIHLFNLKYTNKSICISLSDILLISSIRYKNTEIFFKENIIFFLTYITILLVNKINPIHLYTIHIRNDDSIYNNENYICYLNRIWKGFIININFIQ